MKTVLSLAWATLGPRRFLWLAALCLLGTAGSVQAQSGEQDGGAATSPANPVDYLGAVGIGVSDLQRSTRFYTEVLGLQVLRTYELGYIEEIVLGWPGSTGSVVVLMHWPGQDRAYAGNDVKLVFYVDDPAAVIERIRERGGVIDREAMPHEAVDGAIVGLGRDPDNYVVEVLQR